MNSFRMKALSLAVLGLVGFGAMGSAMAACPLSPVPPWDSQSTTNATLAVTPGGLNGTGCKLSVGVSAGAQVNAKAFVSNTSGPSNEARYRARFYVETTGLTGLTAANRQVFIASAQATTAPVGRGLAEVNVLMAGGTTPSFAFLVADDSQASGFSTITVPFPDNSGEYRVEFDLQKGSPGSFRCWVTTAAAVTADNTPTPAACASTPVSNAGWGGISRFNLGFANISQQARANLVAQILSLDEFDSRRQTFIGK
ncbi:MAG TPA: hypothetical protein VFE67_09205, partial [Rudaea sp.]|nr:hypothetical protein [Rudaea sp.]